MLRVLMKKKELDAAKKELAEARAKMESIQTRESELAKAIDEASNEEELAVISEEIDKVDAEKQEAQASEKELDEKVNNLEKELADLEAVQDPEPSVEPEAATEPDAAPKTNETRKVNLKMEKRMKVNVLDKLSFEERTKFLADESVKNWINQYRTAMKEKRAVENVGLTIPEIVLPLLRENIAEWSKLVTRVLYRTVSGEARQPIMGSYPEGIWIECCQILNELSLTFNDWTVDCFMVGGYFAVCNANLEDSDYDLAGEIILALGQAIGKALDKAILYGRNTDTNMNMPQGVVPSLLQTSQPAGYPTTARPWANLTSTNVIAIGSAQTPVSGIALLKELVRASAAVSTEYSRGNILWLMNDKTYKNIVAETLEVNASGAVVSAINGSMPVVGGDVEVLNFIPDNIIIFGYFDLYLLAERAGRSFASSEHVRFIQNQTVYRGIARYDGAPLIRNAFAVAGLNGATVSATAVVFPQDTANTENEGA